VVGVVLWRRRAPQLACAALAGLGLAASVFALAAPASPAPPGYRLTLVQPGNGAVLGSPVRVVVCGRWPNGAAAQVPGPGRLLLVTLDGATAYEGPSGAANVHASAGAHRLHVEVITAGHVAFRPPLTADASIVVAGARSAAVAACPS
jgi:hypothetical protein